MRARNGRVVYWNQLRGYDMHKSSLDKVSAFVEKYLHEYEDVALEVLDVGSQVVEEQTYSHKTIFGNPNWNYIGMDIEDGLNVDVVVDNPYDWKEIPDQSFDVVVCSQVFEHVQFPWASMMEITRVLRGGGVALIVAPSQGREHRYPYDCWRYYSDGMVALVEYVSCNVVEVRTQWRDIYIKSSQWHDTAIVMQKPFWDEDELHSFLLKNRLSKFALQNHVSHKDLKEIKIQVSVVNSKINEMKCLDVFSKLEDTIVQEVGVVSLKYNKVKIHVKGVLNAITKPV